MPSVAGRHGPTSRTSRVTLTSAAHASAVVRTLPWPATWDVHQFLCEFGRRRGRPVRLWRADFPALGRCQVVTTEAADYIIVTTTVSAAHARFLVLRAVGHLVLGHLDTPASSVLPQRERDSQDADLFAAAAERHLGDLGATERPTSLPGHT